MITFIACSLVVIIATVSALVEYRRFRGYESKPNPFIDTSIDHWWGSQ